MILVVLERDPQVAVDRELAELLVHAHPRPLLFAQSAHEVDEPRTLHYRGRGTFMLAGEEIDCKRRFRPENL